MYYKIRDQMSEFDETKYEMEEVLFKNTCRKVCLLKDKDNKKYLYKINLNKDKLIQPIEGNMLLKYILSDYFPKFYEYKETENQQHVILEYVEGLDLFEFVRKNETSNIFIDQKHIIKEIVLALKHLQDINVVHGDIKPENIIYNYKNNNIKLIDFDTSFYLQKPYKKFDITFGTEGFLSPEVYYDAEYSLKSDIFALGITIYGLCTNNAMPYLFRYNKFEYPFPKFTDKYLNLELYDLLTKMLNSNPVLRYNINQVLEHPFFTK